MAGRVVFLHVRRDAHGITSCLVFENIGRLVIPHFDRVVATTRSGLLERHVIRADGLGIAKKEPRHEEVVGVGVPGRADASSSAEDYERERESVSHFCSKKAEAVLTHV